MGIKNYISEYKKLANKKELKGEEVARIVFQDWEVTFNQIEEGTDPDPNGFLTKEMLQVLVDKIEDPLEYMKYEKFLKIKDWVNKNHIMRMAYERQLSYFIEKTRSAIFIRETLEHLEHIFSCYPRIETFKEHETFLKTKIKKIIDSKNELNYIYLLKEVLHWNLIKLKENPRKKNPLKSIKKEYAKEVLREVNCDGEKTINITKWDLIEDVNSLFKQFSCFSYPIDLSKKDKILESFNDFKGAFKELFKALMKEIQEIYPEVIDLKGVEWLKSIGTYKDLQAKNIIDVEKVISKNNYLIYDDRYDIENGVALIEEGIPLDPREITRNVQHSIFNLEEKEDGELLENSYYGIKCSFYFLQGYNTALELVAEHFNIPETRSFKSDLSRYDNKIQEYNERVEKVKETIQKNIFYTEQEKNKKIHSLEKTFKIIITSKIKTPKELINKAKEMIEEIDFSDGNDFISLLVDLDFIES